jgi:Zn-dependent protease with chaperone function
VDFFARQELARRQTRWLLAAFIFSVLLVTLAVAGLVYTFIGSEDPSGQRNVAPAVSAGIITFLLISGASLFKTLSLRAGGGAVARSLGGTRVERGSRDLALKRLHNVVEEMAIASGVPMPEVYVLEAEDGINAFAAGNTPADAAVAVTRGAITRLNREELQGVIAHEFSHVLNGDMRLNSKLMGWVFGLLVVAIAARIFMQGAGSGRRRSNGKSDGGALIMVALAVMIIGYIGVFVGRILQAAVSRNRERLADASAVQFTRNPQGLVGALLKIAGVSSGSKLESPDKEEVAHMLFAPGMSRLFSTHPEIGERVRELDPSIRPEQLPARAAEAARDAERLRLAPGFAEESGSAPRDPSVTTPASVAASAAAQVASLAGTFDDTQQRYAHGAREAIPESLHAFADSPDAARELLFALLRSADPGVASRQDDVIRRVYGDAMLSQARSAVPVAQSLAPELRLPAVQQLFPALRRMTTRERVEMRSAIQQLSLADDRIDVFECCLLLLLQGNLRDAIEGHDEHGSASLPQAASAVSALFAVLAGRGAADGVSAQQAYEAGITHVLPEHRQPYAAIDRWPDVLRQSLEALAALRPAAKKTLIEGLVRTVAHDRRLSVAEGELLRTVCARLHCPLPPILAAN